MRKKATYVNHKILSGIVNALERVGAVGVSQVENDVDLREFIEDSIIFLTFIVELENEFQVEFPDNLLLLETVSSLYGLCEIIEDLISKHVQKSSKDENNANDVYNEIEQLKLEINELQREMDSLDEHTPDALFRKADLQTQINNLNCQVKDWLCILQDY